MTELPKSKQWDRLQHRFTTLGETGAALEAQQHIGRTMQLMFSLRELIASDAKLSAEGKTLALQQLHQETLTPDPTRTPIVAQIMGRLQQDRNDAVRMVAAAVETLKVTPGDQVSIDVLAAYRAMPPDPRRPLPADLAHQAQTVLRQALAPEESRAVADHQTLAEHLRHLRINADSEIGLHGRRAEPDGGQQGAGLHQALPGKVQPAALHLRDLCRTTPRW